MDAKNNELALENPEKIAEDRYAALMKLLEVFDKPNFTFPALLYFCDVILVDRTCESAFKSKSSGNWMAALSESGKEYSYIKPGAKTIKLVNKLLESKKNVLLAYEDNRSWEKLVKRLPPEYLSRVTCLKLFTLFTPAPAIRGRVENLAESMKVDAEKETMN